MKQLEGRVAVVTGGGSGIGAALAWGCADASMKVVVADIDRSRAEEVAEGISTSGATAIALVDVAVPDEVDRLADTVYETFGATHLLCNNAGVTPIGITWDFTPADWAWVIGVNLMGVLNGIPDFVPRMIFGGEEGHVVNTASRAALLALPRMAPYAATKHAVLGVSDCLRLDLAPFHIGVSTLCPGRVNTNLAQSFTKLPSGVPASEVLAADIDAYLSGLDAVMSTPIEADQVAALVLRGVREEWPYIVTSPASKARVAARFEEILDAHDLARRVAPDLP